MDIGKARQLKIGQQVKCPADGRSAAFIGTVAHVSESAAVSIGGKHYLWVAVRVRPGREQVWPSNRIEPV